MPARYNSRASSMYRYNEPTISQYESFFNPIPLEFVQEQFDRRQGAYDEAYAGAMQAKDQFNNAKVGAPDIQYAKQLTNQFVEDTDKMVQEQFGGDWGKAAKTIARNVTNVRGNEFWQKAEILDKRREEERALTSKYGPNALVFNSIQNKSVYDPATKQMINPEAMSYDVLEKGDWNKTIQDVIGKINPDSNPYGLTRADFGYLKSGQITEISKDKLDKLASDPNIQQAIISAHPEMARAFNELPDKRGSLFGDAPDLKQAVQSMIAGNIGSQQYKQTEQRYVQDWQMEAQMKASAEAAKKGGAFAPEREMAKYDTGYGNTKRDLKTQKNSLFDEKGFLVAGDGDFNVMTESDIKRVSSYGVPGYSPRPRSVKEEEALRNHPVYKVRKQQYDMVKDIVTDIKKNNSSLTVGKSDWEIYDEYVNGAENKYKMSMDLSMPIVKDDINKTIGNSIASNINGTEFYLTDGSKVTKDWNDKNGIGDVTGLSYGGFQEMLRKGELPLAYNKTRGSLYAEIPVIDGEIKLSSDGTINWDETKTKGKKTVYFSPDRELAGVGKLIPHLDRLIKDSKATEELPEGISEIFPTIHIDRTRLDKSKDVNDQEVFKMKDADGNDEWYSLDEIRETMAKYVNTHLGTYYNVKQ